MKARCRAAALERLAQQQLGVADAVEIAGVDDS